MYRAPVTPDTIRSYFSNLEKTLKDVFPENIIDYDKTNLSDDPGRKRVIACRGCKYPERIMNSTKILTSIKLACTAVGHLLPAWETCCLPVRLLEKRGPPNTRYNRTDNGRFNNSMFDDWFFTIVLPYAKRQTGKMVIIGDNLASHISVSVVRALEDNNQDFVLLFPNSTNLTQPLGGFVFRPMKGHWQILLTEFKSTSLDGTYSSPLKAEFPKQLARLMVRLQKNIK